MQVSVESGEGLERRITVELPTDRVDTEVEARLKKLARTARMDGFRPGKVPLSVVRRRYGRQVRQEVFGDLIQSSFVEAVHQEKLFPAGEPKIEPVKDRGAEGYGYTAVFEVMPKFELGGLDSVTVRRPRVEVTEADVDKMLEKLRKQRATWSEVERPAAEGDLLRIDYKGLVDGEPFQGGEARDTPLVLGSGSMIDGFERGLVGACVGDTRSLDLKFPDEFRAEALAGKPVVFEVKVAKVSEPVLPEVDDGFAVAMGVAQGGIAALRQEVLKNMEREMEQKVHALVKEQVMDGLLTANAIDVPNVLVEKEIGRLQEQARREVAASGRQGTVNLPRALFEEQARRRVRLGLIVSKVVEENGIQVDPRRVRKVIEGHAATYEDPQEVIDWYYSNRDHLSAIESVVLEDQVVDWVLDKVQVEEDVRSFETLMQGQEGPDV